MAKKRAWGPSNPLYRWIQTHGRKAGKTGARRGGTMARRKAHRSRSGGRSGGMMSLLKPLALGALGGYASDHFAPQVVPYQNALAGAGTAYAFGTRSPVGLLVAAGGAYGARMLTGGAASGSNTGGMIFY